MNHQFTSYMDVELARIAGTTRTKPNVEFRRTELAEAEAAHAVALEALRAARLAEAAADAAMHAPDVAIKELLEREATRIEEERRITLAGGQPGADVERLLDSTQLQVLERQLKTLREVVAEKKKISSAAEAAADRLESWLSGARTALAHEVALDAADRAAEAAVAILGDTFDLRDVFAKRRAQERLESALSKYLPKRP